MSSRRKIFVGLFALVVIAVGMYFFFQQRKGVSHLPNLSLRSEGSTASAEFVNAQKAVDNYREQIRKNPDVVKNYLELAQLFLQEGRVTGNNAEYIPKAQALLDEAMKRETDNPEIIITRASIAATLHHFKEAKELAEKAITQNPRTAFYYGVLCDALVELGEYDEAVKACDKMVSIRPDLRSYSRVSYLRELHGDLDGAIEAMKMAADAGVSGQENRAWVLYNLGMLYLNQNKLDTAEYIFKGILEERLRYPHAVAGLARVNSVRQKYDEAIELYQQAIEVLNEPAFHEALGEVYEVISNLSEAKKSYDTALELYENEQKMGEDNAVEMAEFLAWHNRKLEDVLPMAQSAIQRRPSIHGYKVLALALYKNGKYTEAQEAIQQAMKLGTKDASMYYLAGSIADKLGNSEESNRFLTQALSINPNFSLIHTAQRVVYDIVDELSTVYT